jgi:hypothetical protein
MGSKVLRRVLVDKEVGQVIHQLLTEGWVPTSVRADGSGATFKLFNVHEDVVGPTDMQMRVAKALEN